MRPEGGADNYPYSLEWLSKNDFEDFVLGNGISIILGLFGSLILAKWHSK